MRVQVRVLPAALGVRVRVPCVPYGARAPRHHLHGEAGQVARSSRLRERDAHACCAAQRERRRAQAGGLVSGGERTQAHDVECGGGGGAEGEDVARVGRAAVVREQERA